MVQGVKINEVTEGGVTVSVWKATAPAPDPPPGHHYNVKVDVGVDWVCIGGGGRGTYRYPANSTRVTAYNGSYLTASFLRMILRVGMLCPGITYTMSPPRLRDLQVLR